MIVSVGNGGVDGAWRGDGELDRGECETPPDEPGFGDGELGPVGPLDPTVVCVLATGIDGDGEPPGGLGTPANPSIWWATRCSGEGSTSA